MNEKVTGQVRQLASSIENRHLIVGEGKSQSELMIQAREYAYARAFKRLKPRYQYILCLLYIKHMSQSDIARKLDVSRQRVSWLVGEAKARINQYYRQEVKEKAFWPLYTQQNKFVNYEI